MLSVVKINVSKNESVKLFIELISVVFMLLHMVCHFRIANEREKLFFYILVFGMNVAKPFSMTTYVTMTRLASVFVRYFIHHCFKLMTFF